MGHPTPCARAVVLPSIALLFFLGCATPSKRAPHAQGLESDLAATKTRLAQSEATVARQAERIRALELAVSTVSYCKKLLDATGDVVRLKAELRNAKFWLEWIHNRYREGSDIMDAPQGQPGVVKAVQGILVSISVGYDDRVRIGDVYQLRRGGTYVGQITITTVREDLSIGKFDEEFKGPGAPPQAGDKADPGGY